MPNDEDDEYYSYKEKDLQAESDWHQPTLFDNPWTMGTAGKSGTGGKHAKTFKPTSAYKVSGYSIPDVVIAKIKKAVEEAMEPAFQQIMDRLDEIEDRRRNDAA